MYNRHTKKEEHTNVSTIHLMCRLMSLCVADPIWGLVYAAERPYSLENTSVRITFTYGSIRVTATSPRDCSWHFFHTSYHSVIGRSSVYLEKVLPPPKDSSLILDSHKHFGWQNFRPQLVHIMISKNRQLFNPQRRMDSGWLHTPLAIDRKLTNTNLIKFLLRSGHVSYLATSKFPPDPGPSACHPTTALKVILGRFST